MQLKYNFEIRNSMFAIIGTDPLGNRANIRITQKKQESKGIRQCLINISTSPMIIHKITPSVDYNQWLKRLNT